MGRTFVVGDIHGAHKALVQCLERSGFNNEEDTLIQLGDIVDGWSEVYEVVEELLKIKNLISIRGNHDEWFQEFIDSDKHPNNWKQGGEGTLRSYLKSLNREQYMDIIKWTGDSTFFSNKDISHAHKKFFREQQNYRIIDRKLYVHGGFSRQYLIEENPGYICYWDRDLWSGALSWEAMSEEDKAKHSFKIKDDKFDEIFIGHTSTQFWGKDTPMKAAMIHNLDTGAGWTGKLTIMDANTKLFWQSDNVKELYPDEKGRNR